MGMLRPEELCKMFPTPPSMEPNPIASPSGHLSDGQMGETGDGPILSRFKQEIYPSMGSPPEELIEVSSVENTVHKFIWERFKESFHTRFLFYKG